MGLIDDCKTYFGSDNLYDVLGIEKKSSQAQIKKAYRKASLFVHPDRVASDDQDKATRKFQVLSKVHLILSDTEKRAVYDETGFISEEDGISEHDANPEFYEQYWRSLFPKLTIKDIENFLEKYKGSEEEIKDLKECYLKYEGNMNLISKTFIGYTVDEEDRIRNTLMDMINKKEIPSFPKFMNESQAKRKRRVQKNKSEAAEAEEILKEMESNPLTIISKRKQERESNFNSMIQNLEAKYCKEAKQKKK